MSEVEDDLLGYGYVRQQTDRDIPKEIIQMIFKWYHVASFIEYYNESIAEIMNQEKTMIISKGFRSRICRFCSCYGSVIMPSFNNDIIYEYTIKVSLSSRSQWYAIGICDATFIDTDTYFYNKNRNKSKFYALKPGKKIKSHEHDNTYSGTYYACDLKQTQNGGGSITVTLIYNAANETLSFRDEVQDYGIASKTYKTQDFSYRLAIYLLDNAGPIELIGFTTQRVARD